MGLSISQSRCSVAFTAHTALARHGFQRHGFGEAHVDDLAGRRGGVDAGAEAGHQKQAGHLAVHGVEGHHEAGQPSAHARRQFYTRMVRPSANE